MRATTSGIGFLIALTAYIIIIIRLYKPAKEQNFDPRSFRGGLFWSFFSFAIFILLISIVLLTDDVDTVYLVGYAIGHIFFYLAIAIYFYVPFALITPESKRIPNIIFLLVLLSSLYINYITFDVWLQGEVMSEVGANGVMVWNPPELVLIYIIATSTIAYGIFGVGLFAYHAIRTKNSFLRKRSRYLSFAFLLIIISGPPHDIPDIDSTLLLIFDVIGAIGVLLVGYALGLKNPDAN